MENENAYNFNPKCSHYELCTEMADRIGYDGIGCAECIMEDISEEK